MIAIEFPGVNVMAGKHLAPHMRIPAMKLPDDDGTVITCWQLTEDELKRLNECGGKFYIKQMTYNVPPQMIVPMVELSEDQ